LDELFPGKLTSILVSVTLVLFFGEIVPSAFFTGPDQVKVAAKLVPMVKLMMVLMSPLAVPIANILDRVLHEDGHAGNHNLAKGNSVDMEEEDVTGGNYYNKCELSALVRIQYEAQLAAKRKEKMMNKSLLTKAESTKGAAPVLKTGSSNMSASSAPSLHTHNHIRAVGRDLASSHRSFQHTDSIHVDEITMIEGALAMTTKVAADICTPLRRVYALPSDTVMDEDTMVKIWSRGFSRIPVYSASADECAVSFSSTDAYEVDTSRIIGVLLTRQLIVVNHEEKRPITTLPLAPPPCIAPSVHLVDLINLFQAGGGRGKPGLHLAIVCARPFLASSALEKGQPIPKECGVVGIVTLEDVVEELLQEEIYDETDRDLELARWGVDKWKKFVKKKKAVKSDSNTGAHFDSSLVKKVVIASEMNTESTPLLR
jgi:metal transporter CNNM